MKESNDGHIQFSGKTEAQTTKFNGLTQCASELSSNSSSTTLSHFVLDKQSDGDERLVLLHRSPQAATKQAFPGTVPPSGWIVL
jgi:hypothetical protein